LALVEKNPGPGSYIITKMVGDNSPHYTIRTKTATAGDTFKTPGPGTYESTKVGQVRPKSPTWKIGTGKKDDIYRELQRRGVPGPGNYESKGTLSGPQYKFGNQKRGFYGNEKTPGPGQYKIPCSISSVPKYMTSSGGFNEQYRYI